MGLHLFPFILYLLLDFMIGGRKLHLYGRPRRKLHGRLVGHVVGDGRRSRQRPVVRHPGASAPEYYEKRFKSRPESGSYADPTGATGAIGRRLLEPIVDGLKRVVKTEF